jgi:hypothetical protein
LFVFESAPRFCCLSISSCRASPVDRAFGSCPINSDANDGGGGSPRAILKMAA